MPQHELIPQIAACIREARHAVAFTGAGISTESGIPDFRSPQGVWSRYEPVYYDEFLRSAAARERYWQQKCESHDDMVRAVPNAGHAVLAAWEKEGRLRGVITQNIDGLHQLAGQQQVLELHGTAREVACVRCAFRDGADAYVTCFRRDHCVPECPRCGAPLKHATVSFGQTLPSAVLESAVAWAQQADVFVALGSSLVVTPAADLPALAKRRGAYLVIINREPTPLDCEADGVLHLGIGDALTEIREQLTGR